jgi:hypothetical protein
MDSSTAASIGSGVGIGSFSTSKRAVGEAMTDPEGGDIKLGGMVVTGRSEIGALESRLLELVPKFWSLAGVAAGPFAASVFRRSPRATRIVPLDCSTLIGLVKTRLAPI